eukprot:TRINITY_DN1560_c0_g2_i2.p1 TRINITY_DN1560_c0_g2~~TRINITY_DN1560_c0_g2_i2.p1  ORF type:complete len:476 (+),score=130.50 TRINITY_DN1560_c0_g2_i2:96-1523(+)
MAKLAVLVIALFICASTVVSASSSSVISISPSDPNWKSTLTGQTIAPGTTVKLAAGTYTHSGRFYLQLDGTTKKPITIIGPSDGSAIFVQTNPNGANALEVDGSNFALKNFKLQQGSLGLRLGVSKSMSNVLIENVEVFNTQGTALTLNTAQNPIAVHKNITIKQCVFHDTNYGVSTGSQTGECMYLGAAPSCSGSCPSCTCSPSGAYVVDSVVQNNLCYNTMQAKRGWGSGFQIKGGSNGVLIVDNTCYNTLGPCILTYSSSYKDFSGKRNEIRRNLVWNSNDIGIQTTSGSYVTDNIILGNTHYAGIGVIPNQGTPADVLIEGNTIFNGNAAGIYVSGLSVGSGGIVIANNAIFASTAAFKFGDSESVVQSKVKAVANGVNGQSGWTWSNSDAQFAIDDANTELVNPSANNFRPKSSSKLIKKGNKSYTSKTDFDCLKRDKSSLTVGAYQYFKSTKDQWTVAPQTRKASPKCA